MGQAFTNRGEELDMYEANKIDLFNVYGERLNEYHKLFFSEECKCHRNPQDQGRQVRKRQGPYTTHCIQSSILQHMF